MTPASIESLAWLLTYLIFAFAIFIVIRQFILWYYRINEIADNIAYIAAHYRAIDQAAGRQRVDDTRRATGAGSPFSSITDRPSNT